MIIEWLQPICMTVGMNKAWAFTASYTLLILGILLVSFLANYLTKRYIHFISRHFLFKSPSRWIRAAVKRKLFYRLSHVAPALVIYASIPLIQLSKVSFTADLVHFITTVTLVYMIGVVVSVIMSSLKVIDDLYQGLENARRRPIKSYLQLVSLFIYIIAGILVVSAILDKSPLVFFTGLGAMMAVLMLVFKDTLLGLVASVQNAQADIMHIGDWVEIPQYGIDGEVVDMALNTIKFQNFDKTIVTLPSQTILKIGAGWWKQGLDVLSVL
jgi:miniconductance mechanosensitive channel